jgi:hypothetical protein
MIFSASTCVIPAKAGIERAKRKKKTTTIASVKALVAFAPPGASWIPASAGMTAFGVIPGA